MPPHAPPPAPLEPNDERFDQILTKLQSTVETLEGGKLSLEESLIAFEEGARLARRGQEILDAAEKRVEVLTRGPAGEGATAPLDAEE